MSNFDKLDVMLDDLIESSYFPAITETTNKILLRDNILVKTLKSIVACEDHWGGAEMQELAEKALKEIGELE